MSDSGQPSAKAVREHARGKGSGEIVVAQGVTGQKIVFNSAELDGGEILRKDEWIASLSSGYARLHADPAADLPFNGELQIALLDEISVGTIHGTVTTISRTAPDIAAEYTDNVVLLWNADASPIRIEQGGRSAELAEGSSVLIEQCEPSWVKVAAAKCSLLAVQAPRRRVRSRFQGLDDCFMTPIPERSAAMLLVRAYADVLLEQSRAGNALLARFAPEHIIDLITHRGGYDPAPTLRAEDEAQTRRRNRPATRHRGGKIARHQGGYTRASRRLRVVDFAAGRATWHFTALYPNIIRTGSDHVHRFRADAAARARAWLFDRSAFCQPHDQHDRIRRRLRRSVLLQSCVSAPLRRHTL